MHMLCGDMTTVYDHRVPARISNNPPAGTCKQDVKARGGPPKRYDVLYACQYKKLIAKTSMEYCAIFSE